MDPGFFSHIILCECLCLNEDKTRSTSHTGRSKFLSSLALVLNGSSTCTAVYVHQVDKTVFIARNDPITSTDQDYFDQFFRVIRIYANLCFDEDKQSITSEVKDQLESLVLKYNSDKIIKRFTTKNNVIRELKEIIQWNVNQKTSVIKEFQTNQEAYINNPLITERIYLIKKKYSEEKYVDFLFETLGKFLIAYDKLVANRVNPTYDHLQLPERLAMILYQSRLFQYVLNNYVQTTDKGVYYFEKISAHIRSLNLVLKCLHSRKETLREIYKNISWKLVPSIEHIQPLCVTAKDAFNNIFTKLSQASNGPFNLSSEDFYNKYLKSVDRFEQSKIVRVHAEVILINFLLNNNINETNNSQEVEIGISKMSCLLCFYYINELNKKYNRVFCQPNSTNGKIYSEWTYRNNEDPSIIDLINQKLINKLERSIQKLCLDSCPTKSGDSDIMFTSLECDDFDEKYYDKVLA